METFFESTFCGVIAVAIWTYRFVPLASGFLSLTGVGFEEYLLNFTLEHKMSEILSLETPQDVIDLLRERVDINLDGLQKLATGTMQYERYYSFSIDKRNGKKRVIRAPIHKLKQIQQCLSDHLYTIYKPNSCVKGYVKLRGIKSNAESHVKKKRILRVDLKDFFPSIHFGRIKGLFSNKPFNFPEEVSELLAEICVYRTNNRRTELPQGAPTSPIISNLICRSLDGQLVRLAKENRCYYSRYADDITFSTNRSSFPREICSVDSRTGEVEIGGDFRAIIEKNGFAINEEKTNLRNPSMRQMVTGLVVNEKVNVPREFIRTTRAMLWRWEPHGEMHGLAEAQKRFDLEDRRNRPPGNRSTPVELVIRGRIEHIGAVRGWDDSIYLKLSKRLSEIDKSFEYDKKRARACRMVVFAEGKTDYLHLRAALSHFQSAEKYRNLELDFQEKAEIEGDNALLARCRKESQQIRDSHQTPIVCIFDRDSKSIINDVTDPEDRSKFKKWGSRVFSFAIPIPEHRKKQGENLTCIELYYKDEDLLQWDRYDRRIFLGREFNEKGIHEKSGKYFWRTSSTKNRPLVAGDKVYEYPSDLNKNLAMTKTSFADHILESEAPFNNVDFEAFSAIFDEILKICDELNKAQKD